MGSSRTTSQTTTREPNTSGSFNLADTAAVLEYLHVVQRLQQRGIQATIQYFVDPSIAYHLELINMTPAPEPFDMSLDFPIAGLGQNNSWADLSVELEDTNGDGTAYLHPLNSSSTAFQTVSVVSNDFSSSTAIGAPLGADINSAGTYNFHLNPFSGPTFASTGMLDVFTRFTLSPGDTVRIGSRFVIDEGTGTTACRDTTTAGPERRSLLQCFQFAIDRDWRQCAGWLADADQRDERGQDRRKVQLRRV